MKLGKYWLPILMVAVFETTALYAQRGQETRFDRELNTRDDQPVREFIESKENIDIKEKASNLEISGDVRFEYRSLREKGVVYFSEPTSGSYESCCGISGSPVLGQTYRALRGGRHVDGKGVPLSTNDFDVEFNVKFKYSYKKAWSYAHLQFDNPAGIRGRNECTEKFTLLDKNGNQLSSQVASRDLRWVPKGSGEQINVNLKRAYIGYNVWADGVHRFDVEVGRRKMDDIFDSEIQFTSRFDGILLKYASSIDGFSDWYINEGVFVIDERVNHFGWVAEAGLIDIMDSGLDLRYNIINWRKLCRNRCGIWNPYGFRFLNSQVTLTYTIHPKFGFSDKETPIEFYGGFLVNHLAKGSIFTHGKKKNLGWYGGVYIGNVHKQGDWSVDLEYIVVQAQAVPEYDVGSIGRGNILNENFNDVVDETFRGNHSNSSTPSHGITGHFPRRGNANFIGYRAEFLYAITDNLSIDLIGEFSNAEDKRIGGKHHYDSFEIEAIYAF